jgi:hypothetical protein
VTRPVLALPEGVLVQATLDEAILLNETNGYYYGLDPTGARMLELLLTLPSVDAVVTQLETEYDVDAATLHTDIGRLMRELLEEGLVMLGQPAE